MTDFPTFFTILCACALLAIWAYIGAQRAASHYYICKREPKKIIIKQVNGHIITTTTRGGEQ